MNSHSDGEPVRREFLKVPKLFIESIGACYRRICIVLVIYFKKPTRVNKNCIKFAQNLANKRFLAFKHSASSQTFNINYSIYVCAWIMFQMQFGKKKCDLYFGTYLVILIFSCCYGPPGYYIQYINCLSYAKNYFV